MKLLFKDPGFGRDYKNLLGFVDADMHFSNLQPGLKSASREMIKLIGTELYEYAVAVFEDEENEHYDNIEDDDERNEKISLDNLLLEYIRYPIAFNAYRKYAPTNDLKHSNNGRMMRVDDNEKSPFQWMIDKDDKNLEIQYYRSLDDLLNFLEDTNPHDWKSSSSYKEARKYFVTTTDDFEEYFPIQSRLLLLKLMPAFRKVEREHLIPVIGRTRFNQLKSLFQSERSEPGEQQEFEEEAPLLALIQEVCVYYALAWGLKRLSAQLFPEGVLLHYVSDEILSSKNVTHYNEAQLAQQEFTRDYKKALQAIERLVNIDNLSDDGPLPNDFGFDSNDSFVLS